MAILVEENENWILTLPKGDFPKEFINQLLELIRLEELSRSNLMSESEAWQIAEDIKTSWWEDNGKDILAKIQDIRA